LPIFLKGYGPENAEVKGFKLLMEADNLKLFLIGNVIAFVVAIIAIKGFIGIIKKYGFKPWGWYRIVAGAALLAYFVINKP
jgi:undecaprenyl-diphosphatase